MSIFRHAVPLISQTSLQLCWEAAGRMAFLWKHNNDLDQYRRAAGQFLRRTSGVRTNRLERFYVRRLGMVESPKQNLSHTLAISSPIIIVSNADGDASAHATVIVGFNFDLGEYVIYNPCLREEINFDTGAESCEVGEYSISWVALYDQLHDKIWHYR